MISLTYAPIISHARGKVNKKVVKKMSRDSDIFNEHEPATFFGLCVRGVRPQNFNVGVAGILSNLDDQTNIDRLTFAPSWKLKVVCHQITDLH